MDIIKTFTLFVMLTSTSCDNAHEAKKTPTKDTQGETETGGAESSDELVGLWVSECKVDATDPETLIYIVDSYKFSDDKTGYIQYEYFYDQDCRIGSNMLKITLNYLAKSNRQVDIAITGYQLKILDENVYNSMTSEGDCPSNIPFKEEFDAQLCNSYKDNPINIAQYGIYKVDGNNRYFSEWSQLESKRPSQVNQQKFVFHKELKKLGE